MEARIISAPAAAPTSISSNLTPPGMILMKKELYQQPAFSWILISDEEFC